MLLLIIELYMKNVAQNVIKNFPLPIAIGTADLKLAD